MRPDLEQSLGLDDSYGTNLTWVEVLKEKLRLGKYYLIYL